MYEVKNKEFGKSLSYSDWKDVKVNNFQKKKKKKKFLGGDEK